MSEKMPNREKAAMLFAASLAAASPLHHEVAAAEVKPEMTWEEGLATLEDSARTDSFEKKIYYIEGENGHQFVLPQISQFDSKRGHHIEPDQAELQALMEDDSIESIRLVHTHPDVLIQEISKGVEIAPGSFRTQPPSTPDLFLAIQSHFEAKENQIAFSSSVVDPRGVWTVTIDDQHIDPKTLNEYFKTHAEIQEIIKEKHPSYTDEDIQNAIRSIISSDQQDVINEYGDHAFKLAGDLSILDQQLYNSGTLTTYSQAQNGYLEKYAHDLELGVAKIQEYAAMSGVHITFKPHN